MPPAKKMNEIQEIMTQLVLLNEQVSSLKKVVERSIDDHEARIRGLESGQGVIQKDIATIRERMTVFNLIQSTLTAIASAIAYFMAVRK